MKKGNILIIFLLMVFFAACVEEEAVTPSADFTTNLDGNTLQTGETFTVYLNNVKGDFVTYFKGDDSTTTFSPDFYGAEGVIVDMDVDSVVIPAYRDPGSVTFTLYAASSGNWAEDYEYDYKSLNLEIVE